VVLVHADRIEAELVGVLEHVEVFVVELMAARGVVEAIREVDPHAVIAFAEVVGEPTPRHQVEPADLHGTSRGAAIGAASDSGRDTGPAERQ
jgi:hypothetical protein